MNKNDTSDQEKGLTGPQRQAALLLAEGQTAVHVASELGIALVTVQRWKKLPDFQAEIRRSEDALYDESLRLLKKLAHKSIMTLDDCTSTKTSAYVRVQAGSKLLDLGLEVHKMSALEREVEQLKGLLAQREFDDA